jgi:hypothetical protein
MAGDSHKERRHLFKNQLESAWSFVNWLTHAKGSRWHDAEAAVSTTENAISLSTSSVIRHIRGVPQTCPACGSHRLSPERGFRDDLPDIEWERPTCTQCDWTGEPVPIHNVPEPPGATDRTPPEGECIIPTVPLKALKKPYDMTTTGNPVVISGRVRSWDASPCVRVRPRANRVIALEYLPRG